MEKRKITVIPTKTHKTQVIESAATTLAELKADLTKAGIDYTDCTFFEGLTKIELKNDAAILPHDVYAFIKHVCTLMVFNLYKFFEGKLLDSLIIGIICFIFMALFRMEYSLLVAVIIGLTNIIPFFGPFIGAVPSIFILLIISPLQALIFAVFILILQQVDGNIIGPRIIGDSVGLSSLWIMFAIIVGGAYFGVAGMILGVPVFSVIYTLLRDFVNKRLEGDEEL